MSKLLSLQAMWADLKLMYISLGKGGLQHIRAVCACVRACMCPSLSCPVMCQSVCHYADCILCCVVFYSR